MSTDPRADQVADLRHRFDYIKPTDAQVERISIVRNAMLKTALVVAECTLISREQSLALTALEDAMARAVAAIVREPANPIPNWVDCSVCGHPRSVNLAHPDHVAPPPVCDVCMHNADHPDDLWPTWVPEPSEDEIPGQVAVEEAIAESLAPVEVTDSVDRAG